VGEILQSSSILSRGRIAFDSTKMYDEKQINVAVAEGLFGGTKT